MSFKKLPIPYYPSLNEKETTPDSLYWRSGFESPTVSKEYGAITHVEFCPAPPYDFAVTNSTRVQIYDSRSLQITRTLQRFQKQALSGSFRADGGLVVAGTEDGLVKVFDHQNQSLLRTFKDVHSSPVHVTRFLGDNLHVISAGDDRRVQMLDVPAESVVHTFADEFDDYLRSGCVSPSSPSSIFAVASYDHRAKMFDVRTKSSTMTVDGGEPLDACLFLASGSILLTAGGTTITAWDVVAGGRALKTFSFHHKSVTCLALASGGRRLLSGGLDKHVKVYDSCTFDAVASIDYPSPILSLAVSPDDAQLVVGMSDGLVSIKKRKTEGTTTTKTSMTATTSPPAAAKGGRKRGGRFASAASLAKADQVVARRVKEKLKPYDYYFQKFDHSKALTEALKMHVRVKTPEVTLAVMEELMRRQRLKAAVAGRTDREVAILITFLSKNFCNVNFNATVMDVIDVVVEVYVGLTPDAVRGGGGAAAAASSAFDDEKFPESVAALKRLRENVSSEVAMKKQFLKVVGMMEPMLQATG